MSDKMCYKCGSRKGSHLSTKYEKYQCEECFQEASRITLEINFLYGQDRVMYVINVHDFFADNWVSILVNKIRKEKILGHPITFSITDIKDDYFLLVVKTNKDNQLIPIHFSGDPQVIALEV